MKRVLIVVLFLIGQRSFSQVNKVKVIKEDTTVYTVVDEYAEYIEGTKALLEFVRKHLVYPPMCVEHACVRTIYLRLVIDKKGKISRIEVMNKDKCNFGMVEESVRVAKLLDDWKPAKLNAKFVNSYFHLPIKFKLG